ncbi:MAG: radical SAM protein [Candidatus Aenigmarchaeota archaeon]|nr:radical SAM protein [Candidatus Aenigmarchaeota archaeon]
MGICKICKSESQYISSFLGLCRKCIIENPEKAIPIARKAHETSRKKFDLTPFVPKNPEGLQCLGCGNECKIPEGERGYCGLVENKNNKLIRIAGTPDKGLCEWYYDALPTNCVSIEFCPGGTGCGYPNFAKSKGPEYGYYNLSVFYGACVPFNENTFVSIEGKPQVIKIGKLVEEEFEKAKEKIKIGEVTWIKPQRKIGILSFDPLDFKVKFAPVTRMMKKPNNGELTEIELEYKRRIHVSSDHPLLVLSKEGFKIKPAKELRTGEEFLPILKKIRRENRKKVSTIDLIELLMKRDEKITVHNVKHLLYAKSQRELAKYLSVKEHLIGNWRRKNSMPLLHYLKLEGNKKERMHLRLSTKYSKKNFVPAILRLDKSFARLLGFYLAEGCLTKEKRTSFDLSIEEMDLAREVQKLVKKIFNIETSIRKGFRKGEPSAVRVVTPNRILYHVFESLGTGSNSCSKKVPSFVFDMFDNFVKELLDSYFLGNGHAHEVRGGIIISSNSISHELNYGIILLLARFGIIPRISQKSVQDIIIEGNNSRFFYKSMPSLVKRKGLKFKRLNGRSTIAEVYPTFLFKRDTIPWKCKRVNPRHVKKISLIVKKLVDGDIHVLKINSIKKVKYDGYLYDLEVNSKEMPYHNFMHGDHVFTHNCNFNCLFCQNWHFKNLTQSLSPLISAEELASKVNDKVTCICYFGGTPDPQLSHAIETSKIALELKKNDILRICLESNGNANWNLLKKFAEISLNSGGCIKVDVKAYDDALNLALTGVSNKTALKNFRMLAKYHKKRPEVPFLCASTLLVPGYVEEDQVKKISKFITNIDPTIPYSLLAFYPHFMMKDLPFTSRNTAQNCLKIVKKEGLEKVRIGNLRLLI